MPNGQNGKGKKPRAHQERKKKFAGYMREEIVQGYDQPFMSAVSALPRQDLAKVPEALVNLTAFLMHMTADQDETVAEPIDVALLSKCDGFTWVRHKELIRRTELSRSKTAGHSARQSVYCCEGSARRWSTSISERHPQTATV